MNKEIFEGYRLSPQQERLWYLCGSGGASVYRAQCAALIEGKIDSERLQAAVDRVIARHEILRTSLRSVEAMSLPVQVISESHCAPIEEINLTALSGPEQARQLGLLYDRDWQAGLARENGSELQVALARVSETRQVMITSIGSIWSDKKGLKNVIRDVIREYEGAAGVSGGNVQYADVSEVFNQLIESEETKAGREYWVRRAEWKTGEARLIAEKKRKGEFRPKTESKSLTEELREAVRAICDSVGAEESAVMLGLFGVVISRMSLGREIRIGVGYDGRTFEGLEDAVGVYARYLPIVINLDNDVDFSALVKSVGRSTQECYKWQNYFDWKVVLTPNGGDGEKSHFCYLFEYEVEESKYSSSAISYAMKRSCAYVDRFKVKLSCYRSGDDLTAEFHYDSAIYDTSDISELADHYLALLQSAAQDSRRRISRLAILSARQRELILNEFNQTRREYNTNRCVHELIAEQAARGPEAVALVCEHGEMLYAELNSRANQLANYLRGRGVGPEQVVGVMLSRSIEMVVGLLGVIKAGGAYLPLDADYPKQRLSYMLQDARVTLLLTEEQFAEHLPEHDARIIYLDADWELIAQESDSNPPTQVDPTNLVYVLYTSGSTGNPKGAMLAHNSIVNCICWMQETYRLNATDRFLMKTSLSFDPSVWELFWPLLVGGAVVLADPRRRQDTAYLSRLIDAREVTSAYFVPSMLRAFLHEPDLGAWRSLRRVICGGESLSIEAVNNFFERIDAEFHHSYGPTETSIAATEWTCHHESTHLIAPIGKPLGNIQVYILDAAMQPAPIGLPGELYISGICVGRGYFNRPGLTAERFFPDPFSREPGARVYRTGDLGRWLPKGEIEFLGRVDFQVKIRGFRIELGEIETRLMNHPDVREAAVQAREEGEGGKQLVAYYTGIEVGDETLRAHLSAALPEYMIPAAYVHLESLPLTANGKVDRRALPEPEGAAYVSRGYEPPDGEIESKLALIWADLLKVERVGRCDNFFELGGHSLLAMRAVSKYRQLDASISITDLFTHPTIESLASFIQSRKTGSLIESAAVPLRTGGAEPPLFLAHEGTGEIIYGQALVPYLAPGFPVYGLVDTKFSEESFRTIQGMATRMVGMIRTVQPDGPYRIAGWSFGATLAYEIATQLIGADLSVEFLGSLDGYYFGPGAKFFIEGISEIPLDDRDLLLQQLSVDAEQSLIVKTLGDEALSFDDLVRACQERMLLPAELSIDDVRRYLERIRRNRLAGREYVAHLIPIPMHLFAAEDENVSPNPLHNWELALPAEQIRLIPVPGTHQSIVEPPHIASLGEALSLALRQARETKATHSRKEHWPLLSISDGSGGSPVLCAPGAGSTAIGFLDLAESLRNIGPVEGLQSRGLDGALVPHTTVQAAARAYLQCVEQKYQGAPAHLLGHSFGGWIAFEMAQLLRAAGREVASLTILDSDPPEGDEVIVKEYSRTEALMELVDCFEEIAQRSLDISVDQIDALDPVGQLKLLSERLVRVELMPLGTRAADLKGTVRAFEAALRTRYRPEKVYRSPVLLALANDPKKDQQANEEYFESRIAGWRRWAPDLKVWRSPGAHMSMLGKPHVAALADWLSSMLSMAKS